jgi:hypothetical protein
MAARPTCIAAGAGGGREPGARTARAVHPRARRRDAGWTARPPAARGRRIRRPRVRPFRRRAPGDGSPSGDGPGASAARNADRTRGTGAPAGLPHRPRAAEQFASAFGRSRRARACDGPPRRGPRRRASGRFAQDAAARSPVWRTSLTASSAGGPSHSTRARYRGNCKRRDQLAVWLRRALGSRSVERLAASAPTLRRHSAATRRDARLARPQFHGAYSAKGIGPSRAGVFSVACMCVASHRHHARAGRQ